MKHLSFLLLAAYCIPAFSSQSVYTIHGFYSTPLAMMAIADDLKKQDYKVRNWDYDSRLPIDSIARRLYLEIKTDRSIDTVNFVTHSMGGIIVRALMKISAANNNFPFIHRIVMISPPNKGAELADFFKHNEFIAWVMGPNVDNLATDTTSYVNRLPLPENVEIGVIAGAKLDNTGYNPFIAGDNDGFMKIERTRLGMEKDFSIVPEGHLFITLDKKTRKMASSFLKNGRFDKK
jgi:triacylglycerol lipase